MGLDCSHDAFNGAYSAFNRLRQEVAWAIGGSYPPHLLENEPHWVVDQEKDSEYWYWGDGYGNETHPGLKEFLSHSDCDGAISPEMCVHVANELEALLPKIEDRGSKPAGHIALQGGYAAVLRKFIAGCRAAAAAGEPLEFF